MLYRELIKSQKSCIVVVNVDVYLPPQDHLYHNPHWEFYDISEYNGKGDILETTSPYLIWSIIDLIFS